MKIIPSFHSVLTIILLVVLSTGCEKSDSLEVEPEIQNPFKRDSLFFELDGKTYSSNRASFLYANSGVNLRSLAEPVEGMKQWVSYGGGPMGYYAPADSIYYSYGKRFDPGCFVSFNRRFHTKDLNHLGMWQTKDIRKMLEKGKQKFAIDAGSRNSFDGVYIGMGGTGSTGIPLYNYAESPDRYKQDDAYFEIINTEVVNEEFYRIEAKFEINIYNDKGKTRVTNGYLLMNIQRELGGVYFF